jgi:putative flippase GtrA
MTLLFTRLYAIAHNLPREPKRFVKFLLVGSVGFVVDFGVFNLIHFVYDLPHSLLDEVIAQAVSFTAAVVSNFLWNYFWIYPDSRAKPVAHKIGKFWIVSVMGLLIRTPVFTLALPVARQAVAALPWVQRLPINVPGNLALVCAVSVVLLWNFFVNRYWTYNDVE